MTTLALIVAVMTTLFTVLVLPGLVSAAQQLVKDEVVEGLPRLSELLLRAAANRYPEPYNERFAEEFQANLWQDFMARRLSGLAYAVFTYVVAPRRARALTTGAVTSLEPSPSSFPSGDPIAAPIARLLVVDDDPHSIEGTVWALRRSGVEVDVAPTLALANEAVGQASLDLVILDQIFLAEDGPIADSDLDDFAAQVADRIPLVWLSAHEVSHERVGMAGCLGAIEKADDVYGQITSLLSRSVLAP
jgi:CheY-like chemotaxis protein